ncbi:MAG: outer membrane protein assembly factor BamE [Desulfobacterales bacterium]|nr:outer membrane protein assembly factor BamE [Desulfobacterales bacterium]
MRTLTTMLLLFLAGFCWNCASTTTNHRAPADIDSNVRTGMTEDAVLDLLGEPALVDPYQVGKYIFLYPTKDGTDCVGDPAGCAQVVFKEGRVIAVWHHGVPKAEKQAGGFQPRAAPPSVTAEPQPQPSPVETPSIPAPDDDARRAGDDTRRPDADTRREIERLERQVRQIPAARTMDNLRIYRYLLKLDPDNPRYQQKVARYEAQYQREEDQRELLRREREERRKRQNEILRSFEGNDHVRIAVENQGNGRYYVWIQYNGTDPIDILPEHFTLVCEDNRSYGCYRCRDLEVRIAPGESAEGPLTFDTYAEPRELVFSHPAAGTVRRVFPE